jgi:hypothetical protein
MSFNDQAPRKPPGGPGADVDYAVGYGRPPREHQFKRGDPSPNPKGRPAARQDARRTSRRF